MAVFHGDHFALMELIWEFKISVIVSNFSNMSVYFVGDSSGKNYKAWTGFSDPYRHIDNTHFFLYFLDVLTMEA